MINLEHFCPQNGGQYHKEPDEPMAPGFFREKAE
jgi:hypothetical protein